MRKQSLFVTAATAVIATALLAACSGGASQGTSTGLPSTGVSQSKGLSDLARTGVAPKFLKDIGHPRAAKQRGVSPDSFGMRHIWVTDFGTGAVDIVKYNTWAGQGSFTTSMNGPDGDWVDKSTMNPDLYVANYNGPYITEYSNAKTGNPPTLAYTYSTGMADPVDVTTDKLGNVYEADYNYTVQGGGYVNEYAHMSNTVVASCSPGGNVEGVAVDKHGNVFVAWNNFSNEAGSITEYAGGLAGCNGTVLPITFGFLGGIALDKITGNLIVCDQTGPNFSGAAVDVVGYPSYSSITGTLGSGYTDPFHVTIDMANDKAYVADLSLGSVQVLHYPSGTNITTLGSANGITQAASAVDTHNSVVNL